MENPKLFISYSWSNPVHEQWVLDLAIELREFGVDVILDKWDLKEGHDSVAFMEKMVTDPSIGKVVIVADEVYANKADGRSGGVGTETQIISKEIYDNQVEDKFVAVVAQKDETGKPYLPTYYKSRIYIDLSEADSYIDNFETLIRWIYGKPLYVKPKIGKRPSFLDESVGISLGTTASFKRTVSAIKESKPFATGALDEYLITFSKNLAKFSLNDEDGEFDDKVIANIEKFTPYRNEVIQLLFSIAQYAPSEENVSILHRFFESLIPYMHRPFGNHQLGGSYFDNFRFIVHELFLYAVAIFIKYERFDQANIFLTQPYYLASKIQYERNNIGSFTEFWEPMSSLEHRNKRLELRRLSLRADMLEQRSKGSGLEFRYLMQADFILFMRAELDNEDYFLGWRPETLVYVRRFHSAFEVFARSISKTYFDKVKCLLNINQPSDLDELLETYKTSSQRLPHWQFDSFSPSVLLGYEQLAKKA